MDHSSTVSYISNNPAFVVANSACSLRHLPINPPYQLTPNLFRPLPQEGVLPLLQFLYLSRPPLPTLQARPLRHPLFFHLRTPRLHPLHT